MTWPFVKMFLHVWVLKYQSCHQLQTTNTNKFLKWNFRKIKYGGRRYGQFIHEPVLILKIWHVFLRPLRIRGEPNESTLWRGKAKDFWREFEWGWCARAEARGSFSVRLMQQDPQITMSQREVAFWHFIGHFFGVQVFFWVHFLLCLVISWIFPRRESLRSLVLVASLIT